VLFNGSASQRWLSTAPGLPTTHWFQLRCCLQQPLLVLTPNTKLSGSMRLVAHARQSYDVHVELHAPPVAPGMAPQKVRCNKMQLLVVCGGMFGRLGGIASVAGVRLILGRLYVATWLRGLLPCTGLWHSHHHFCQISACMWSCMRHQWQQAWHHRR
jgi:hypothetical protein